MRVSIHSGNGPDANDVRHAKSLPCEAAGFQNFFNFEDKDPNKVDLFLHFVKLDRKSLLWMVEVVRRAKRYSRNFVSIK